MLAVIIVMAGGYWWMNRPEGPYEPDNSGLYPIAVDGKSGFMDRSGTHVIAPQFDEAREFSEGFAAVRVGTKWGYVDRSGAIAITPQFDAAMPFRRGRAAVKVCCGPEWAPGGTNRFGVIDENGTFIHSPDLLWIPSNAFESTPAPVRDASGEAFLTRAGQIVLAGKLESVASEGFSEGLAAASVGGKWGYIDARGEWVINPQFEAAWGFASGLAPVQVGERVGYIDRKGRFRVNPQYGRGRPFHHGLAIVSSVEEGRYGAIDTEGRVVIKPEFGYVDDFSEDLAAVSTRAGWGFIDRTGKIVIPPAFDYAGEFAGGLAVVWIRGQPLYIDKTGTFVGPAFNPVVVSKGACPFEGCQYGGWIAREPFQAYSAIDGAPLREPFAAGTAVTAVSGEVHAKPSRAVVTRTYVTDNRAGIQVGSAVYPLYPLGEGAVAVWHDGQVKESSMDLQFEYATPDGKLEWTWWVQVQLPDGRLVWVKNPQNFTGMDRFG